MANLTLIQNNFISGEISPLLEGRIDSPRYQTGLRLCQNMLPMRQGGLKKRMGTIYRANIAGNNKTRLIPYTDATGAVWILAFSTAGVAWYTSQGAYVDSYALTLVWDDIQAMTYAQYEDEIWIACQSWAPTAFKIVAGALSVVTGAFTGSVGWDDFAVAGNYPAIVFVASGRLGFARTANNPSSVFLSRPPDATTGANRCRDFTYGTASDNAIVLTEAEMGSDPLQWIVGQRRLIAGTEAAVWMDTGQIITPASFDLNKVTHLGAHNIQPVFLKNMVIYAGPYGTSLHALIYSEEQAGFMDLDLTKDAEHILASPVVQIAAVSAPDPIIWAVREDGLLVSCTLDLDNGILAWAQHPMGQGRLVESIAASAKIYMGGVLLAVNRSGTRTIELMPLQLPVGYPDEQLVHVDSASIQTYGTPTATVSGISHLNGLTCVAWADGAELPPKTISGGTVTYDRTFSDIVIGIPVASKIETMRPEVPANGTSQGKNKRIEKITARVYRSIGGELRANTSEGQKMLTWVSGTYLWGSVPPLYTGDLSVQLAAKVDQDSTIILEHNNPAPFTLLALMYRVAIVEV